LSEQKRVLLPKLAILPAHILIGRFSSEHRPSSVPSVVLRTSSCLLASPMTIDPHSGLTHNVIISSSSHLPQLYERMILPDPRSKAITVDDTAMKQLFPSMTSNMS
jgi:hypothetical protein